MAPGVRKKNAGREVTKSKIVLDADVIAKRRKRHLEDLERSNFTESASTFNDANKDSSLGTAKDRAAARTTISTSKKKSTMKVRTALLYKKNLATIIDENGIASLPKSQPTYLTAVSPPSVFPPQSICSTCGYWGHYRCMRCAMPYCDMNCKQVHDEMRCEKRVA